MITRQLQSSRLPLLLLLVATVVATQGACSYSTGTVDYRTYNLYSAANAGNLQYEEILPIQETQRDFVWTGCSEVTSAVARVMFDRAKSMGGNALFNVRWVGESGFVSTPTCERQWGWFLAYVLPGLGPWITVAKAEGTVIKVDEGSLEDLNSRGNVWLLSQEEEYLAYIRRNAASSRGDAPCDDVSASFEGPEPLCSRKPAR